MNINVKSFLWPLALVLILGGCNDDSGGSGTPGPEASSTTDYDIYLPKGVRKILLQGDIDGYFISAGDETLESFSGEILGSEGLIRSVRAVTEPLLTARDLAGFFAERPAVFGEADASGVIDAVESQLSSESNVLTFSSVGREVIAMLDSSVGSYSVTTTSSMTPTQLASALMSSLAVNSSGGVISNYPQAVQGEPTTDAFFLIVGATFFSDQDIVISVAVVPNHLSGTYQHISKGVTNPTNVAKKGTPLVSSQNNFSAIGGGGRADFLFAIDNSGSMGDEQQAVSDAAIAFESTVSRSGLDFKVGIVTSDSSILRDSNSDGGFTSDISEFKVDAIVGTGGSGTESGLFHAEESLGSSGSATVAGYPRSGASLSVIFLSDEPDQYSSYSGGATFDSSNNLFVSNSYRAYAIVNSSGIDYVNLADATGGSSASIDNPSEFPTIMNLIAQNAGGASSQFILTNTPVVSSISVSVNGTRVNYSSTSGWDYNIQANTIVFYGAAIPGAEDSVQISYHYMEK